MARRIVLAVLALVAAVLGSVAVPLGVITTDQDVRAFQNEARVAASALSNVAEERLDDKAHGSALGREVSQLTRGGDKVLVVDRAGRLVAGSAARPAVTRAQLATALATGRAATYQFEDSYTVVAPVRHDSGSGSAGVVVLARPTSAIERQAAVLWGVIAAVA